MRPTTAVSTRPISGVDRFDSITGTAIASTSRCVTSGRGSAMALIARWPAPRCSSWGAIMALRRLEDRPQRPHVVGFENARPFMPDTTIIACPNCGSANRVANAKLAQGLQPICGKCKRKLPPATAQSAPLDVTDATFAAQVERSPLPVLVDAWAAWCGPCRTIAPAIEELAQELAGQVRVAKLNVDENPGIASRFNIRSIPTMLVMMDGREIDRIVGAQPKAAIKERLERAVAAARRG